MRNESSDSFIPFAKHSIRNIAKRELRRAFRDMEWCSGLKNKRGSRGHGWSTISGTDYRWPISCWEPRINICMAVAPTVRSQQRAWKSQAHWSWLRSLPLSPSLLSSALVCLSSTHYWMCWIPLLQVPIVLQTNCCKLKLALLHSVRVQVSWLKGFDCWIS